MDLAKNQARTTASRTRAALLAQYTSNEQAGILLRNSFLDSFPLAPGACVSGYWPTSSEIDIRPLMNMLSDRGHPCCMPVVINKQQPMRFRQWTPGVQMVPGRFGIPVPPDTLPEMRPDIVLVPLLAFDRRGMRLGRGGGLYDRTIELLRATGKVIAVGISFSGQEVASVPFDVYDQRIDWIVTESQAFNINTGYNPLAAFGSLR